MSETITEQVPNGFEFLPEGLGFTDNLRPCYRRLRGGELTIGMLVAQQHANTMGICHGGALMTLADIAASSWVRLAKGELAGSPTVNLSIDFIAAAKQGQWIEARAEGSSIKRLFGFSRGVIVNSRGVVARFNATFYFPDHPGMSQDGLPSHGALDGVSEQA